MPRKPPPVGRPWPKGVSGNPAGRPRNASLKDAILADLDRTEGASGRRRLELLARRLGDLALGGDPVATRLLLDRLWPVRLELAHQGEICARIIDLSSERSGWGPVEAEIVLPLELRRPPTAPLDEIAPRVAEPAPQASPTSPAPAEQPITLRRPAWLDQMAAELD